MADRNRQFGVDDAVAAFPNVLCKRDDEEKKDFEVLRVVGSGVSGTAFLVQRISDKRNLIAKVTDLSQLSEKKKAYARSEVTCLSQCDHFAIIRHVGHFETTDSSRLLLMMELADAGDLGRQIKHRYRALVHPNGNEGKPTYFREHEVAFLFLQVVMSMHYLHRKTILHRDIKSANVFLMSVGIVKLGDLGFSQIYSDTVSNEVGRTFCGTPYYLAPELWRRHRYSKKADVWSLGVLLYEMACLKRPFVGDTMLKLYDKIMGGKFEPLPDHYSQELKDLVSAILVFDPDARPATGDILRMNYMKFVMTQFERTISSGSANQFSQEEKDYILRAVNEAKASIAEPAPTPSTVPSAHREIKRKGICLKYGTGGWKERYCVFDGLVLTVSQVEATVGQTRNLETSKMQGVLPTDPKDVGGRVGCFSIVLDSETGAVVHFQAASEEDARLWVTALTDGVEAHQRHVAELAAAEQSRPADQPVPQESTLRDTEEPSAFPTLGGDNAVFTASSDTNVSASPGSPLGTAPVEPQQ